jgi:thiopeptide-type bacteriocin biosynthesis protein
VESGGYFREAARYGGEELMPAVERLFQASSELILAVLDAEDQGTAQVARVALAVRAADAMASGLGLDLETRLGLAQRCRAACARAGLLDEEHARQEYRRWSRQLFAWLTTKDADALAPALMLLKEAAASVAKSLDADLCASLQRKLPVLLHVQDVRLAGANADAEALAHYLWHRTLEGITARNLP